LVVIDYSWASIHAILDVFNRVDVIGYAHHIFEEAKHGSIKLDYTYLLSCAAHTMKRFSKAIKKFHLGKDLHRFICYCFSLLLNSTTLEKMDIYFDAMCSVFLSQHESDVFKKAVELLEESIASRPDDIKALDKILNNFLDSVPQKEDSCTSESDSPALDTKSSKSIKDNSPFTHHYQKRYDHLKINLPDNDDMISNNIKYCPQIMEFLMDSYIPYVFIWASFTCQDLEFSRLTNGLIESYNKYRKQGTPDDLLPHRYINTSIKYIIGSNEEYLNNLKDNFKKSKKKKEITKKRSTTLKTNQKKVTQKQQNITTRNCATLVECTAP
jgi:hypothetical protein